MAASVSTGSAIAWALLTSLVHLLVFSIVVTTRPPVFCDHCAPGRSVNEADVAFYFRQTSPELSRQRALIDYPPLSKLILMAPRLFASREDTYIRAFMLQMFLVDVLAVFLLALRPPSTAAASALPGRLGWYTAYVVALSPLIFTRFDLVPAVLAFAAASTWGSGRSIAGAVGAALGASVKVFPGCVAALGFVHEFTHRTETRWRATMAFVLSIAVLALAAWPMGGHVFLASYGNRNLQIESAFAGMYMVVGKVAGLPMAPDISHGAIQLGMRGVRLLATLTLPVQAVLLFTTLRYYWRSRSSDFLRYTAAATLALMVPAKVLSPQYLIWLVLFVPVLEGPAGRRARWLFLACCLATIVVFPFRYFDLVQFRWPAIGLLNLRNALLLMLWVTLLLSKSGEREVLRGGEKQSAAETLYKRADRSVASFG